MKESYSTYRHDDRPAALSGGTSCVAGRDLVPRWLLGVLLLLTVLGQPVHAQAPAGAFDPSADWFGQQAFPTSSADLVDVSTFLSRSAVRPGESFKAAVFLTIADGWHINSNRPLQEFLIGTSLEVEPHSGFVVADMRYPQPRLARFAFAGDELAVYEGSVPVFLEVRSSEGITGASDTLRASLRVQACNDEICLRPAEMPVGIPITLAAAGAETSPANERLFAAFGSAVSPSMLEGNLVAGMFAESGFILAFLSIFLIGLALNLTPCVYPMLSVTVSLFGGQTETQAGRAFGRAALYVFGIVAMYSVLGVAAALTGSLFGAWLQSPWVLGGVGVLLFVLAASMFGLYEMQLPSGLTTRLGAAHRVTGPLGLFLAGLVVGIFAAPCIGPPVVALLAFVGAQGDPLFGFAAFFVLASGLGLPYLVLGTFSGLLTQLPKSGMWMVWVKRVFGVVLIGAGLFYLGLAFAPRLAPYALPVTLVGGGLYVAFALLRGRATTTWRWAGTSLCAMAVLAGVLAFLGLQRPGIEWTAFSDERLETARHSSQPVLLDFYADWCIPCLEMDRVTFTNRDVVAETADLMTLKVDLTQFDSPEGERLRREFGVAGVPTLIFLAPDGEEVREARVVGFMGPRAFLETVRRFHARVERRQTTEPAPRSVRQID